MQQQDPTNTLTVNEAFKDFYRGLIADLPEIGMGLLIIVLGVFLGLWIGRFAKSRISARTHDPLLSEFLGKTIRVLFFIMAIMLGLQAAGFGGIATGILTAAGAGALILGFAFKDIGENFIAGFILAFNRPFNVNDTVEIGKNFGKVKALEFRYTKMKTFDGKDVYIPNIDVLTKPVTNYTEDGFFRWDFTIGIAYEDSIEGAKKIIMDALKSEPYVLEDEIHKNFVIEDELGISAVNLKVFFWIATKDYRRLALVTKGDVIRRVKEALEENGYYLPADIKEIKLYGPEKDFPVRIAKAQVNKS